MAVAEANDIDVDVVLYLKNPPDRAALEAIVDGLEDPVGDLVRKDAHFKSLGLDPDDFTEPGPVIDLLLAHPRLLQRPLITRDGVTIIGRPKDRVEPFLTA